MITIIYLLGTMYEKFICPTESGADDQATWGEASQRRNASSAKNHLGSENGVGLRLYSERGEFPCPHVDLPYAITSFGSPKPPCFLNPNTHQCASQYFGSVVQ